MKKWLKKNKRNLYLIIGFVLVSAVWVYAASVPNTFQSGQPASASQVNANFSYLADRSWELSGSDLYYNNGNVGIGTASPITKLDVQGSIAVGASGANHGVFGWQGHDLILSANSTGAVGTMGDVRIGSHTDDMNMTNTFSEAMRIDSTTGNVGIGTGSPRTLLEVVGSPGGEGAGLGQIASVSNSGSWWGGYSAVASSGRGMYITVGDPGWTNTFYAHADHGVIATTGGVALQINTNAADNNGIYIDTQGLVGIGTTTPTEILHVAGNIYASGTITQGSSRELKQGITDLSTYEAMETLKGLNPVKFIYKADKEKDLHIGFIAEDVPDLVASRDRKGLSPMDIVALLTKVVQSQQKKIEELETRLNKR